MKERTVILSVEGTSTGKVADIKAEVRELKFIKVRSVDVRVAQPSETLKSVRSLAKRGKFPDDRTFGATVSQELKALLSRIHAHLSDQSEAYDSDEREKILAKIRRLA